MSDISSDNFLIHKGRETTEDFLAHHGVLGMKWGIRKDGKPQGWQGGSGKKAAKAVGSGAKKVAKGTAKAASKGRAKVKQANDVRKERKAIEEARLNELSLEEKRRQQSASYKIASTTRSARTLARHMDSLDDNELRNKINRIKLENEVRELSAKERERSRNWLSKTLEQSAKNSVKSVATYGMTKAGRQAIDGLFEELTKANSDNANKEIKDSITLSGKNKGKKVNYATYDSDTINYTPSNSSTNSKSSGRTYGSTASSKSSGTVKFTPPRNTGTVKFTPPKNTDPLVFTPPSNSETTYSFPGVVEPSIDKRKKS